MEQEPNLRNLEYAKGSRHFEDEIHPYATFDDLDKSLIKAYKERIGATDVDSHQVLTARGFIQKKDGAECLTNAAVLLFVKNILKFNMNCRIRFIRIDGREMQVGDKYNVVKDKSIDENFGEIVFVNEYMKLQHVYERKNDDVRVLTPDKNVIEFKRNWYELPADKVHEDDRVRAEKHGRTLLIYHALTNDLICKHMIPDGEGNSITLPKAEKALSIEEELLLDYKDYPVAKEFFAKLRKPGCGLSGMAFLPDRYRQGDPETSYEQQEAIQTQAEEIPAAV